MRSNYGIATGSYIEDRDDWGRAITRAAGEAWRFVELTAIAPPLLESLAMYWQDDGIEVLGTFERVSIHAPVGVASPETTVAALMALPTQSDVVFHPDVYGETKEVATLARRAIFENMDIAKRFGRKVDDLATVFARFPNAGFCLDVAHVWTNDPTLELGHTLLDAFGGRLRQLHVSGIEPDGTHRTTTQADLELYQPLLERCGHVPWLLEGVMADRT